MNGHSSPVYLIELANGNPQGWWRLAAAFIKVQSAILTSTIVPNHPSLLHTILTMRFSIVALALVSISGVGLALPQNQARDLEPRQSGGNSSTGSSGNVDGGSVFQNGRGTGTISNNNSSKWSSGTSSPQLGSCYPISFRRQRRKLHHRQC